MSNQREILKKKVEKGGYKYTAQRKIVIDVLRENKGKHLKAEEIYKLVKVKDPKIGFATIYRTLNLLSDLGIVGRLELGDEVDRFEYRDKIRKDEKYHLICENCNRIVDIDRNIFKRTKEMIQKKYGFKIEKSDLSFYGICKDCSEEENNK